MGHPQLPHHVRHLPNMSNLMPEEHGQ